MHVKHHRQLSSKMNKRKKNNILAMNKVKTKKKKKISANTIEFENSTRHLKINSCKFLINMRASLVI